MPDRPAITATRSRLAQFVKRARMGWRGMPKVARWGATGLVALSAAVIGLHFLTNGWSKRSLEKVQIPAYAGGPHLLGMPAEFPVPEGAWRAVPAFPHVPLHNAVFLTGAPRTERLFVCEREGRIVAFDNDPATSRVDTFLDVRSRCQGWDDCGLLGLAFHPEFGRADSPNRGYFYVSYQFSENPTPGPGRVLPPHPETRSRLARFTLPDGARAADPESELVLIDQPDRSLWHAGGALLFGIDDGFLYLSLGDEGAGKNVFDNAQRIDRDLFSGVIRIDVDCVPSRSHPPPRQPERGRTAHYFIPNDNPFVGIPNALEEFWCLGLRSPHRMTQDPVSGEIWIGDVGDAGSDSREEINLIRKGGNYQWDFREGTAERKPQPSESRGDQRPPVLEYPRANGNYCVIGGHVYRGTEHAADLSGKYVFGDNASGRIWTMERASGTAPVVTELCALPAGSRNYFGLSSFGVDRHGELYLCVLGEPNRHGSGILKLARTGVSGPPVPRLLSQTGAFRDTRTLTPAAGLLSYEINLPLWSDGASKRRWLSLPRHAETGRVVPIARTWYDQWTFPAGSVFVKHFELEGYGPGGSTHRIETRLLVQGPNDSAYGVTYKWRADQSDAELVERGFHEEVVAADSDRKQTWFFPGPSDCLTCHNANAGFVLGVNLRQINRQSSHPPGMGGEDQLQAWNRCGLFEPRMDETGIASMPRHPALDDESADLEARARAYLDVNCSSCHRPGEARASFDARIEAPWFARNIINGESVSVGAERAMRIVAPGDPSHSLLLERMRSATDNRMPPLARSIVDRTGVELIERWISQMAADRVAEDVNQPPVR